MIILESNAQANKRCCPRPKMMAVRDHHGNNELENAEKKRKARALSDRQPLSQCPAPEKDVQAVRVVVAEHGNVVSLLNILFATKRRSSHATVIESMRKAPFHIHAAFSIKLLSFIARFYCAHCRNRLGKIIGQVVEPRVFLLIGHVPAENDFALSELQNTLRGMNLLVINTIATSYENSRRILYKTAWR